MKISEKWPKKGKNGVFLKLGHLDPKVKGRKKTLGQKTMEEHKNILKSFINWLVIKGYKIRGIEEKGREVKQYLDYAENQGVDIHRAGTYVAESYREYLRLLVNKRGSVRYNPKTINGKIAYLRLFYQYLISTGKAHKNPFLDIDKMKESENIPKNILTIDEIKDLLESIQVNTKEDFIFKLIIEILYASGLRISELEDLKRDDVHPDAGYIVIRDDKSRQERNVPLTEYSSKLLKLYLENIHNKEKEGIFRRGKKRSLNRWINNRLKSLSKRLKLPTLTCHGIRHTMATHLLKYGADLREVQEILGHKRIRNTEVYTRIFPEDLKEMIEKTHPRERGEYLETNAWFGPPSI